MASFRGPLMAETDDDWHGWLARHGPALLLLARQYVRSTSDAEDVVQDAFVRFWQSRDNVRDRVAFLYVCVKRCALDWQRGRQRQVRREQAAARPEADTFFVSAPEACERQHMVETVLRQLPAEQAEVLVMKIWGGLTFQQIAEALGLSPNTIASRYRYALARLREALTEEPSYE
jgi:RNA polymerase sigma-70 factor (ECF subfamily)